MNLLASFDELARGKVIDEGRNFQWRVARKPSGDLSPADFEWHTSDIPEPGPGQVLLKTHYLGLAPVMRMYMQGTGAAGEAALKPGDVIHGRGVAQIVRSRHPDCAGATGLADLQGLGHDRTRKNVQGAPARRACHALL